MGVAPVDYIAVAFPGNKFSGAILPEIKKALEEAARAGNADAQQLQQVARRVLGRYVGTKLRRRPMIIPVVVEA